MGLAMPGMDVPKMHEYKHYLTDLEFACGVTLEQVAEVMPKVLLFDGDKVMIPRGTSPALATSVARCALACDSVDFVALSLAGEMPIYKRREG